MSIWTFVLNLMDLNIHTTIKKNYIEIMPTSIPHQILSFYHLPTRGRARIKLGDAWYVSNVSIIFDCSMLLYYPFWMFMGFIYTFISFLGLIYWPRAQCQFLFFPLFQCFEEMEYQTESKRHEINWRSYFWNESHRIDLDLTSEDEGGAHEGRGAPTP